MYHVNFNSAIPIYEQLERQTQYLIASGALPENELIPSVREVAKTLAVNPQTVTKAYANLKTAGLIQPLRGQGYIVSPGAQAQCSRARLDLFQSRIETILAEAAHGRLSIQDIRDILDAALKKTIADFYPTCKGE